MSSSDSNHDYDDVAMTLVDRFLSASSGPDAQAAVEALVEGLEQNRLAVSDILQVHTSASSSATTAKSSSKSLSSDSLQFLETLLQVLTTSHARNSLLIDQGPTLVARFYTAACKNSDSDYLRLLLLHDASTTTTTATSSSSLSSVLIDSLVAVAVDAAVSDYPRVLCLELLHYLCEHVATRRLLTTLLVGNGTTQLAQLLLGGGSGSNNGKDGGATFAIAAPSPVVYQHAMRLALLLSTWPAVAKNWIFMSVLDQVLLELPDDESHLTHGPAALQDALQLLQNLLQHSDASLVPLLVLESPVVLPKLTELLDLRLGSRFRFPNDINSVAAAGASSSSTEGKRPEQRSSGGDDVDDLDNLLQSGSSKGAATTKTATFSQQSTVAAITITVPYLVDDEESIVTAVLVALASMLEDEAVRQAIIGGGDNNNNKYDALVTFLWELGLLIRPDTTSSDAAASPFACAVPSLSLQQKALQVLAQYCCQPPSSTTGLKGASHAQRLDRLLYLVCTGGSASSSSTASDNNSQLRDQLALSQSALHCFRNLLSPEQRTELLLYSLAPPPPPITDDDDDATTPDTAQAGPDTSIVARLLNTVFEQLTVVSESAAAATNTAPISDRCQILLSGAASALMVLLTDGASRSMLLKLTQQEPSLMDQVLECLSILGSSCSSTKDSTGSDAGDANHFCAVVLLRFVAHWIAGSPQVIHQLLQSPSSTLAISTCFASTQADISTMTTLLLGLVMNDMGRCENNGDGHGAEADDSKYDESLCGGWTRASIMEMMTTQGISRVTSRLEAFKNNNKLLPWSLCFLEWNIWKDWCGETVLVVRKRLIQELTAGCAGAGGVASGKGDDAETDLTPPVMLPGDTKSLQKLVSQQAREMTILNQQMLELRHTVTFQERQMTEWKKRLDSNPTQLDDMLNDYSSKITELERQNLSLMEDLHQRDSSIETIQNELKESRAQNDESRQESESLRDELTALSHAYSNLEIEYQQQRSQHNNSVISSAAVNSIVELDDAPRQQAEGEESQQSPSTSAAPSTEVAMLRADNSRLRQDAQAADEWMAMAVEKLNDLGNQNTSLIEQMQALQEQVESSANAKESDSKAELVYLVESEKAANLELEARYSQKVAELELLLQHEQAKIQELRAVESDAEKLLETERSRNEDLQEQLNHALDERRSSDALVSLVQTQQDGGLEQQLDDALQEIRRLTEQVATTESAQTAADETSSSSQHLVSQDMDKLKQDFAAAMAREQQELYRCEARIRDLEARLDGGLGKYTIGDIHQRDHDIAELQKANEEAQAWMANAMEQHQLLSSQVNSLVKENSALAARVREQNGQAAGESVLSHDGISEASDTDLCNLRRELALRDETICQLRIGLDVSASAERVRLAQLEGHVDELTRKLEEQQKAAIDVIKQWSDSYTALEEDRNRLQALVPGDLIEGDRKLDLERKLHALEEQRLTEEQAALAAVKGWEDSFHALETSKMELAARVEALLKENAILKTPDLNGTPADRLRELEAEVLQLQERLVNQEKAAMDTIAGWQESYAALETNRNELISRLEASAHDKMPSDPTEGERITELTHALTSLKAESAVAIKGWQERFQELEMANKDMQVQVESSRNEPTPGLVALQNDLAEARTNLSQLQYNATIHEASMIQLRTMLQAAEDENTVLSQKNSETIQNFDRLETEAAGLRNLVAAKEGELTALQIERDNLQARLDTLALQMEVDVVSDDAMAIPDDIRQRMELLKEEKLTVEGDLAAASEVILQWEASYRTLEAEKNELLSVLGDHPKAKDVSSQPVADVEDDEATLKIADLVSKIKYLEEQHVAEEIDAQEAIDQWQSAYHELEAKQETLQSQIGFKEAETTRLQSELTDTKEKLAELRLTFQAEADEKLVLLDAITEVKSHKREKVDLYHAACAERDDVQACLNRLEEESRLLKNELAAANDIIIQWKSDFNALKTENSGLKTRLQAIASSNNVATPIGDEQIALSSANLQKQVKDLEDQLVRESDDAQAAIDEWQSGYNALEMEKNDLQAQLDTLIQGRDSGINDLHQRLQKVEEEKLALESELALAGDVVAQWEASYSALEAENIEYESRIQAMEAERPLKNDVADDVSRREAETDELEGPLVGDGNGAQATIDHLQAKYDALESEMYALRANLHASSDELIQLRAAHDDALARLVAQRDATETQKQNFNDLNDLRARLKQLEQDKCALETELTLVNDVAARWEARFNAIEAENTAMDARLIAIQTELDSAALDNKLAENETALTVAKLEAQVQELEQQLVREGDDAQVAIADWQSGYESLEREKLDLQMENNALAGEKTDLQARFTAMEGELAEIRNQKGAIEEETALLDLVLIQKGDSIKSLTSELDETKTLLSDKENLVSQLVSERRQLESRLDELKEEAEAVAVANENNRSAEVDSLKRQVEGLQEVKHVLESELAIATDDVSQWEASYSERSAEVDNLKRQVEGLQEVKQVLESELAIATDVVSQWEASYSEIDAEKVDLESRLSAYILSMENSERKTDESQLAISKLENRCIELESEGTELQTRFVQVERESAATECRVQELETLYKSTSIELQETRTRCETLAKQPIPLNALEDTIHSLQCALTESERKLSEAMALVGKRHVEQQSVQESFDAKIRECDNLLANLADVESRLEASKSEIETLSTALTDKDNMIHDLEKRIKELENDQCDIHKDLQDKRRSCDELATFLQEAERRAESLRDENIRLSEIHRESMGHTDVRDEAAAAELQILRDALAQSEETITRSEAERKLLQDEYGIYKAEAEATIELWKTTLNDTRTTLEEAQSSLNDVQQELTSTSNSAELAIEEWESRCRELDARIGELTLHLETTRSSLSAEATKQKSSALAIAALDAEVGSLKSENAHLLAEQQRLVGLLQEREHDLKEAANAVEFQITNTISDRATALASEALRKHVDELRSSLQVTQQEYLESQESRRAAEKEADLLREDLAALLGMKNTPETQAEIRRQALHMKEDFRRKERAELNELKDALSGALDRLEASHEEQLVTEERISRTNLQISIYEQELVSAKSDLNLLTEKLDEMRQAESSQRESMEYRISELQNEYQVMEKQHASRLNALQNELSQATMERDRLMKALKESERSKDSFLTSTTLSRDTTGLSAKDVQVEIHKLRLEKAHLLNTVAEEAAAVERRIRDARAVAKSVAEAEVIVERELRMSAEKTLTELKNEMAGSNHHNHDDEPNLADEYDHLEGLREEIQSLHEQNMSLAQEVSRLEEELMRCQEVARVEQKKLTEELRSAMTRNIQLEREGRQEAEFYSEMARLRNRDNDSPSQQQRQADNPAAEDDDDDEDENVDERSKRDNDRDSTVRQYYDETRKLTDRLAHDRAVYLNLVNQHDTLLSMLAQEKLFSRTVQSALERVGGKEAIKKAMLDASEKALSELGKSMEYDDKKRE